MADNARLTRITGLPRPFKFKSIEDAQKAQEELYRALSEWRVDIPRPNQLMSGLIFRPEWYGAVGDGVTDDTTAIQATIDAAESAGGGVVVFSPKTYIAGGLDLKSHVYIFGMGWSSVLKQINTSTYLISANEGTGGTSDPADNIHDIHISGMTFLGTSSTDGFSEHVHLLNINAVSDITIDNMMFVGPRGDAIHIGSSNVGGNERHNERIVISGCYFDGDGRENRNGITVADATGLLVEDCYFYDIGKSTMPGPIDIEPDDYAYTRIRDVVIRGCSFKSYGGNVGAISVVLPKTQSEYTIPVRSITIENCSIDTAINASSNGIIFYVSGGAASDTDESHGITIRNNRITGTGANGWAINTGNVKGCVIDGNYIHDCLRGVLVNHLGTYDSYDISITNNTIVRVGGADEACGLHVFEVTRLKIDGNSFIDCGQSGYSSGQAIVFNGSSEYPATSDYVYITNNVFSAGTRMLYHTYVAADHTISPPTNRFSGNTIGSTLVGTFDAYITDLSNDPTATYDSSVLPQSFPVGRSVSVSNSSDTGLPGTYYQGLLVTERYCTDTNYTKWIIQFYYPANEESVSLSEIYYRKAVHGNTWSAWQQIVNMTSYDVITLANGDINSALGVQQYYSAAGFPTTYRHKVETSHSSTANQNKWDLSICDGTGTGYVSALSFVGSSATLYDQPRTSTSLYRRYYHIPLGSSNPGASGATWVDGDANTTGGWQLNAAGEKIRGGTDIHSDWDGASDMKVEVRFNVNVDNTGGAAGDTVDLKLVCYYKGIGDTATKTQTVEVPTTVGASAQYKAFKADFTLDWDASGNVLEAGDHISMYLNLETDTSEVDDVIITGMSFSYLTTHIGVEDGDE